MKFATIEEAKLHACHVTDGALSPEKAPQRLEYLREQLARTPQEYAHVWQTEIAEIERWLTTPEFQNGDYARGVDSVLFELIEWRSTVYAFQNVALETRLFATHSFYERWLIGATYATFSLLGQLTGKSDRESSLRRLWFEVGPSIAGEGACTADEFTWINQAFRKSTGHFDRSRAMMVRHSVIAHNQKSPRVEWREIDRDIQILVRIWSLIVSWSSFGRADPFQSDDQTFSGLEGAVGANELRQLKEKRREYLQRVFQWALIHLHNDVKDPGKGGFTKFVATTTSVPNS